MTSKWTNKHDIMRDLCVAQGGISVDIPQIIAAQAKPPNQIVNEEIDIDHFGSCSEDLEFQSGPDLALIKEMLDMVKQTNVYPDVVAVGTYNVLEISKINPQEKNTDVTIDNDVHKVNEPHKKRKQRNVAIASLLALSTQNKVQKKDEESESKVETDKHLKLLKPTDFITKIDTQDSAAVVHELVNSANTRITEEGIIYEKKSSEKNTSDNNDDNLKTETKTFNVYKPSSMADLYYKKYLERSKLKASMQHDEQTKHVQILKKIDVKELDIVRLPYHRHLLTEDCIVCRVLCKKYVE